MYDICALGEILIDAIASADTSIQITGNAGGAPANVLTCASRMGLKTAFLAKAGDDFIGGWLKRVLDGVGIDTAGLILDSTKNTTIAMVSLDGSGNRSFSFYRTGCADVSLTKEDLRLDRIEQSRVFHFGSVSMTDEPARSATLFAARRRCVSIGSVTESGLASNVTSASRLTSKRRSISAKMRASPPAPKNDGVPPPK